ncbi:MAG: CDP-diacylglycerol--glycerol-3-phosphate 3-phosphatidyltransferase [Nitrospiraceae bacterium]|nr:CDP-diacylglycerol--glycerol-3-phosphate 3-phosphatidyltransferase [Nitrospiraceae bacterium]
MNLPNKLTVARFGMTFAFVGLMSTGRLAGYLAAYLLFIAATLTDYYDGKIARARGLVTDFGKLLDPVADKVLLNGALIMLMKMPGLNIPAWTVVVIIAREFLVTGARSLAATRGTIIGANIWGKTKAVIQMVYVFVFLALAIAAPLLQRIETLTARRPGLLEGFAQFVEQASFWAIVFVALFTLYSGIRFMRINWVALNLGNEL